MPGGIVDFIIKQVFFLKLIFDNLLINFSKFFVSHEPFFFEGVPTQINIASKSVSKNFIKFSAKIIFFLLYLVK